MSSSSRWFRRLLRLLPADFQADYSRDMERTFRAQEREAREHGRPGVMRLWLDTLVDLMRTAPREHADQLRQDVAYALRVLRQSPVFTVIAVLTLALGIGANTAMFSAVHAVLLAPLPYPQPDRLVRIYERNVAAGVARNQASPPNVLDWQQQSDSFTAIAGYRGRSVNLSGGAEPRYVHGARVSASFFGILGISPLRGRTFTEEEDRRVAKVAVITYGLWQSQFGGDEAAVGRAFDLDGEPFTIVGVLPAHFRFHQDAEVWLPLGLYAGVGFSRGTHNLNVVARLKSERGLDHARAEMTAIASRLERQYPHSNSGWSVFVEPLRESAIHDVRTIVLVLLGAVGFVLLVACANIGSMLVARAAGRGEEFIVRVALGASRTRLVRQLLTEAAMLALGGGAIGIALAFTLIDALRRFQEFPVPRLDESGLHAPVLMLTASLTMFTGVLFGVLPAMHVARWEARGRLRGSSRGETAGRERRRMQALLNIAQVAVALVLLAGAGVMVHTLLRLSAVDVGFDSSNVTAVDLSLSDALYPRDEDATRFYQRIVAEVSAAPGVRGAAMVSDPPLTGGSGLWSNVFTIDGRPPKPPGHRDAATIRWVTPQYFAVLQVHLLRGRVFAESDSFGRPPVALVNAAFVRRHFPHEDPIGRRVSVSLGTTVSREIVGVVADIRQTAVEEAPEPQIYLATYQSLSGYGTLLVRSNLTTDATLAVVGGAVRRVDPLQPLFNARPMRADLAASIAPRRVTAQALSVFAVIALGLALLGIYAVAAYQVSERTREFGVRLAVGACPSDLVLMVVRQGMAPAVVGVLLGLAGAVLLTRLLSTFLFETRPLDARTFAAAVCLLLMTATVACIVPARRATRVDPNATLRVE